jgi:hypothetical protein
MSKLFVGLALLLTTVAKAEYSPPPVFHHPGAAAMPESIRVGDQYFDLGVGGIEDYMDSIKGSDPKAYQAMLPELERLQSKSTVRLWTTVGVIAVGAGLTAIGATSSPTNFGLLVGGLAAVTAGMFVPYILGPGRSDYMDFVNKHNRARPSNPLKIQLGFAPTPSGAAGMVAFTF